MKGLNRLLFLRRGIQAITLAILPLLSLLGWLRIDVDNANLTLFGLHIWAHEAVLVVLLTGFLLALLAGLAAIGGRSFCGWICPQTALSEFASFVVGLVRLHLRRGPLWKRLAVGVLGAGAVGAVGAIGGVSIVAFFVPASAFASLLGPPLNTSLLKGLSIATILVVVVVFVFRHMWCEWICLFGWLQRLFTGPGSLRIGFDLSRSKMCTNCGACRRVCFMKIEPRRRQMPPTCLNCAKCITACGREMESIGLGSLINLGFYGSEGDRFSFLHRSSGLRTALAVLLVLAAGCALTLASISRPPVQVVVRQAEPFRVDGDNAFIGSYHVDVYNNLSQPLDLELEQTSLDASEVEFSPYRLKVGPRASSRSNLKIAAGQGGIDPGRQSLSISASVQENFEWVTVAKGRVVFIVPPARLGLRTGDGKAVPASVGMSRESYPED